MTHTQLKVNYALQKISAKLNHLSNDAFAAYLKNKSEFTSPHGGNQLREFENQIN